MDPRDKPKGDDFCERGLTTKIAVGLFAQGSFTQIVTLAQARVQTRYPHEQFSDVSWDSGKT